MTTTQLFRRSVANFTNVANRVATRELSSGWNAWFKNGTKEITFALSGMRKPTVPQWGYWNPDIERELRKDSGLCDAKKTRLAEYAQTLTDERAIYLVNNTHHIPLQHELSLLGLSFRDLFLFLASERKSIWDFDNIERCLKGLSEKIHPNNDDDLTFIKNLGLDQIRNAICNESSNMIPLRLRQLAHCLPLEKQMVLLEPKFWRDLVSLNEMLTLVKSLGHNEDVQWECVNGYLGEGEAYDLANGLDPKLVLSALSCSELHEFVDILNGKTVDRPLTHLEQYRVIHLLNELKGLLKLIDAARQPSNLEGQAAALYYLHHDYDKENTCFVQDGWKSDVDCVLADLPEEAQAILSAKRGGYFP